MTSWPALNVYANLESTATDPADPSSGGTWADIGAYVESIAITRGVSRWDGVILRYQPGTCSIVLKNTDGRFDPLNLSGPYVSGGVSFVRPSRGIAVQAVWNSTRYYLFRGGINSWTPTYPLNGENAIVTVDAIDGLGWVARNPDIVTPVVPFFTSSPTTSQMVRNWLLQVTGSVANSMLHGVAAIGSVGEICLDVATISGNKLAGVQLAVDTELGEFWLDGNGVCKFRVRNAIFDDARSNTSQATFQPNTSLPFDDVTMTRDTQPMINSMLADNPDATVDPYQADNNTSQAAYSIQKETRVDLLHRTYDQNVGFAEFVVQLQGDPELRFDNLTIVPQAAATDLFPQVLGRELGDRITVAFTPPGSSAITRGCIIRGIQHTLTTDSWTTRWALQDATPYDAFLILDDATRGILDTNRLGY